LLFALCFLLFFKRCHCGCKYCGQHNRPCARVVLGGSAVSACGRTVAASSQLGWSEVPLVRQAASRWTRLCIVYVCVCVCSRDWTRSLPLSE
jgi:hypothetical protein